MAFVMCSCDNDSVVENSMVTISFNQQMVNGLPMTRGETNDFLNIIAEQTPTYVNVTLKNLDLGKKFTCKSNGSITIPVGEYEIYANKSGEYTQLTSLTPDKMYKTPTLNCNTFRQTISSNTTKITLNVYYSCYAIFALIDECKDCQATETSYDKHSFYKNGKYYVGYFSKPNTNVTLTPYDDSNEFVSTTYNFSTTYDVNKVYAEYGKYYVIHPQQVDKVTSSFTMQLPNMVEGEI